jgi:hypothetical protein
MHVVQNYAIYTCPNGQVGQKVNVEPCLPVVTDGNWAPRGPRKNYKGNRKMGLSSLGR